MSRAVALLGVVALLSPGGGSWSPASAAHAEGGGFFFRRQPQRDVSELSGRQQPAVITGRVLDRATQENTRAVVSLSRQRIFLMVGDEVAIDSPISSGRRGHATPTGDFRIKEKDLNHMSNIYGNYCDRSGRVVRSGISSKIDSAPAGTHYVGAPMKYFCRLTDGGVGFHIGILPGYAASHGCIRLPADIAPRIYEKVKVGTSVRVEE